MDNKQREISPAADHLHDVLEGMDLTQTKAAEMLGVKPSTLSNILNGRKNMSLEFCCRLEYVFGLRASFWASLDTDFRLAQCQDEFTSRDLSDLQPMVS
ncbi:HigA family addiction module antitoxin [Persicirhabdus sediminis]|uniref:HigA family addiction module antidote protein n=1 Tax=Persicirhabdus sediminis TaxID=454144 RepID=A0A8J7MEF7_9BACT|nr:HigA family addiction module antitoxin [Persicirhabdus sediminis]MBK1791781.1 HigA family addiction module antidote protein [Persicirhabdus sediminis]